MRNYLKFAGVFYGTLAFVSLMLGLVSALGGGIGLVLLVFGMLSVFVSLVIGAVVLLIHGVRCAKQLSDPLQRTVVVLVSPVLTVAALLALLPLAVLGHYVGNQANRDRYRPSHEAGRPIIVQPAPPAISDQEGRSFT